jgi:5-methylcytosine-specific restriction endonuclease McrA
MPINYKEYHPKWSLIRRMILRRAKNKCEECGVVNHSYVHRRTREQCLIDDEGATWIVLTISHQDQDKHNNRFSNLKALCQRCHLRHDIDHHVANRKYGRKHKEPHQLKIDYIVEN